MSLVDVLTPHKHLFLIAAAACFLALCWSLWSLMHSIRKKLPRHRLKAKQPLTGNELEFFRRLQRALPEYDVMPQVAMSALIETSVRESHPEYWELRRQFSQKVVDYVIYRRKPSGVVALIELDDRTHDAARDARRDALTASAGLRTLRFSSRAKPDVEEIRRQVKKLDGAPSTQ